MKVFVYCLLGLFSFTSFAAPTKTPPLTVYTYDSFAAKSGLGPTTKEIFEKKTGRKVTYVTFPNVGEALNQVVLEGKNTRADVLVGVDSSMLGRALKSGAFLELEESVVKPVPASLRLHPQFLSFDHGYLAFVFDNTRTKINPSLKKLSDINSLTSLNKRTVITDPRTSSLGLSFLLWLHAAIGEGEIEAFSKTFSSMLLTTSSGWSGAYALFMKKEADLVLSYTTSPAYHLEEEKKENIQALVIEEGHYRQIETAAVLKTSKNIPLAKKYLETLVSKEVQTLVPTRNWMYPVVEGIPLPESFKKLPAVKALTPLAPELVEANRAKWVERWVAASVAKP